MRGSWGVGAPTAGATGAWGWGCCCGTIGCCSWGTCWCCCCCCGNMWWGLGVIGGGGCGAYEAACMGCADAGVGGTPAVWPRGGSAEVIWCMLYGVAPEVAIAGGADDVDCSTGGGIIGCCCCWGDRDCKSNKQCDNTSYLNVVHWATFGFKTVAIN